MMKKIICVALAAGAAIALASCNSNSAPAAKFGVDGKTPLPEAVDIGLVVNGQAVKWASFNLGASEEYEYGNYYAWGETEPKEYYSSATYSSSDNDAAQACLGDGWRMPTLDEFNALLALREDKDNYDWVDWAPALDGQGNEISDSKGNPIRGIRITHKSSGNSIFFPAAGLCSDRASGINAGAIGSYWSSSLDPEFPSSAYTLFFGQGGSGRLSQHRFEGYPIRPVYCGQ